jgi:Domain of unknown function (DUF4388)/Protein of unknown function (DUF1566)
MEPGVGGQIHGISLDSFLQMAQMEKTTCTLTIRAGNQIGYLYILKGTLIFAETGNITKTDAFYEIIGWDNVIIEIENTCPKKENEINQPLMSLLMDGLRLKDEKMAQAPPPSETPDISEVPTVEISEADIVTSEPDQPVAPSEKAEEPPEPVEQPEPAAPVEKKKPAAEKVKKPAQKRPLLMIVGILFLLAGGVVAAVVGLGLFESDGIKTEYENLMLRLDVQGSPEDQLNLLQDFMDIYPTGQYAEKAENKAREIQTLVEDQEFDRVITAVSKLQIDDNYEKDAIALYNQYISKYPEGSYTEDIQQQILKIRTTIDDADYQKVQTADNNTVEEKISVYEWYLDKHPEGKYQNAVKERISKMGDAYYNYLKKERKACEKKEDWENCIKLSNFFIANFKDDSRLEEVVAMKIKMKSQNTLADLTRAAQEKGTDFLAARKLYTAHLKKNPESIHKDLIAAEVKRIDQKIAEQTEWHQIVSYSSDKRHSAESRLKRAESYYDQYPAGSYSADAKKLVQQLRTEKRNDDLLKRKEKTQKRKLAKIQAKADKERQEQARIEQHRNNVIALLKKSGERFRSNGNGTATDLTTGLMWTLLDSHIELKKCLNYDSAKKYVAELDTGGYRDWRLPTAAELAGIYKSEPFYPASGALWYWSSESYVKGFHDIANIVTSKQETIYKTEQHNHTDCGSARAVRP